MAAKKNRPYDWTQFRLRIEIAAPPQKVFDAWTSRELLEKWFPVAGVIEPRKGGRIMLTFLGGDSHDDRVTSARRPGRLQFPFGKRGEQVRISLRKVRGGTLCELHQFNMGTTPKAKIEMHMGCQQGWTFFLTNLKAFLEHGLDLRSHDPRKSYRQGYVNS